MLGIAVTLAAATLGAQGAGGWQYTTWGMTPAEVATASKEAAPLNAGVPGQKIPEYQIGNVGTYKSGKYEFRATFYYQSDRLSLIKLKMDSDDGCRSLSGDLTGAYGKPFDKSADISIWQDVPKNTRVSLFSIGDYCSLDYMPLRSVNNSGL